MRQKIQGLLNRFKLKSIKKDKKNEKENGLPSQIEKSKTKVAFGLSKKLIIMVTALLLIVLPIMNITSLMQMKTISFEKQEFNSRNIGFEYSNMFRLMETEQLATMKSFTKMLDYFKENNSSRDKLISSIESVMMSNDQTNYVNIMFAPNQFDGRDAEFTSSSLYGGYENAGQFGISIIKSGTTFIHSTIGLTDFYESTQKLNRPHRSEPMNLGSEINPILYMSLNIPIQDRFGEFLGAISILLPLKDIQTLTEQYSDENSTVSLITNSGVYVAHSNIEKLNTSFDYMDEWNNIISGEVSSLDRTIDGEKHLVQYIKLPFLEDQDEWIIEISTKYDAINSEFNKARNIAIVVLVITIIILAVCIFVSLRLWVLKPIKVLNTYIGYIADGDLTKRLEFKTKDEFNEIAKAYNEATDSLSKVLSNVSDLTLNVSATSEQMTASAQHTAKASENITTAIEQVSQSADKQYNEVRQSNEQINEMMDGITRITESVMTASESASTAEQQTVNGQLKMKATIDQMENVQASVTRSNEAMNVLTDKANEINKIVVLIETLSQQTNLLALNAAIEASRAGEAGRGFNVVAKEIRHLSDQTKDATKQINDLIKVVQDHISSASDSMVVGANEVMKTVTTVNETGQLFEVIRTEVEHVHTQISEVSAAAEQLQASSTTVGAAAENIAAMSQDTMSNANEVAAASEEQLATMQEMATSAESLSEMVNELTEKMSKFKI